MEKEEGSRVQGLTSFAPEPGYFLPLSLLQYLRQNGDTLYEGYLYRKQTYRNRLYILSSTGLQSLSIPLLHPLSGQKYNQIRIAYREPWQRTHLRAIATAYGKSPYFYFWKSDLELLYTQQPEYLFEWNRLCLFLQARMCKQNSPTFSDHAPLALRYEEYSSHLPAVSPYLQTFYDRMSFVEGVSGIDLGLNGE